MSNRVLTTTFAVLMASAAGVSLAAAQSYPPAPGYSQPMQPAPYQEPGRYAPQGTPDFDRLDDDEASHGRGSTALSSPGFQQPGPPQANYSPDAPLPGYHPSVPPGGVQPGQPQGNYPQANAQPGYPQGPVMSPDDPRYGRPGPAVIYSNRDSAPAQPGAAPGYGQDVRPPAAIDGQANAAPGAPARGADGRPMVLSSLPPEDQPETGPRKELPERLRRQEVNFVTKEPPGTIVVDTANTQLYYVLGHGRAIRYGIRVGREGFTWTGVQKITRKAEWPDWHPPAEMIERQPYLPRFMAGGDGNPLGARAMYLGNTVYRIHGTNQPSTIGQYVSSGCFGLLNEDVTDLFDRVKVGTRVVVLPGSKPPSAVTAAAQPAPAVSTGYGSGPSANAAPGAMNNAQSSAAMAVPNQGPTVVPPLPAPVTIR